MEDWAEIRRLYRSEKLSQAEIARRLGLSRNTVAKAVRSEAPPRSERVAVTSSAWARVEPAVRALLAQFPTMPATVLAQRVGWTGGQVAVSTQRHDRERSQARLANHSRLAAKPAAWSTMPVWT